MNIEQRLAIGKAALMEAGANPDAIFINGDGEIRWHPTMVDPETIWRSHVITRVAATHRAACFVCFTDITRRFDHGKFLECESVVPFDRDCGRAR